MADHGLLVLAHKSPALFERLVDRLAPHATVIAHVDASAPEREAFEKVGGAIVLPTAHRIRWGSFAMVAATLDLVRFGLANTNARTFTLISGDSYPLIHPKALIATLDEGIDRTYYEIIGKDMRFFGRIANVYLPDTNVGELTLGMKVLSRYIDSDLTGTMAEAERARRDRTAFLERYRYAKGSQWWSLRRETLEKVVAFAQSDALFLDAMRFSAIPDEAFFQTAIVHLGLEHRSDGGPIYANWNVDPAPHTFRDVNDIDILRKQTKMFARKFSDESSALLDRIERELWL